MEEPLSQAMEDDQEIITEDIVTEETPAEDRELRQDGNSENSTSCGTHINVLTTDNKDHPGRQAGKEETTTSQAEEKTEEVETSQAEEVVSRIEELKMFK